MSHRSTRRDFLKTTAATGIGYWIAAGARAEDKPASPNDRIRMACIGVGGKGSSDSKDASDFGDVVAVCDVDDRFLNGAVRRFQGAKPYKDFRKMLEEMRDGIDAVTISTADHTHAPAALMAMRLGKHCFCQKPLTHSIYEARLLGQVAAEQKVATMMGNQGTAMDGVRRASALIKAGALGTVKEVHVWTNRPAHIWLQGADRPASKPCPKFLEWDLWLGPAPVRDYAPGYHPTVWRGWWDFGCGALGDMGCHTANMPFMALDLRNPVSVQAQTSGHNRDSFPKWSLITYEFAATDARPALKLFWYDGGKLPSRDLLDGKTPSDSGCLVVGDRGKLFSPNDYGAAFELLGGAEDKEVEFEKSPGHFDEWIRAIKGGQPAKSNFTDYASPLTETILLGNLAVWVDGEKVEWDAKNMKATNVSDLESLVKPNYRKGYVLDV